MSAMNGTEYKLKSKNHPRRSAEAQAYALRVRDGTGNLFGTSNTQNGDASPRGGVRLRTAEAKRNYDLNKGCMAEVMGGGLSSSENQPPVVNQSESFRTAESNKGEAMRNLMDKYGELDIIDRPIPKLKGEDAQHYADRNHGTVDILFHNYGNNENIPNPPVAQRLGQGALENAKKSLGAEMGPLLRMEGEKPVANVKYSRLHQESKNASYRWNRHRKGLSWDEIPPSTRLRPEGEQIVARYNNGAMKEIMGMNENNTNHSGTNSEHRSSPKVNGQPHYERNGNFLNGYSCGHTRGHVSPTRTKPEAIEYHNKNKHSEVGAIIRGEPLPATPSGRKITNRNLVRSEEW
ncbi:uncharacterized protein LOC106867264 isoform X1 [Octopus bimaculoides]|uniref:uncharacterized protein LOC106867264 isoform X1 n=1 Tax=Octopus bimaculoides TaxID=37653 RepID=UPI00071DABFC|nr:uncharacterized protein LOC106867264 isoform X1 [Octopus bimaculoides]XP_014767568.1 uncharacterized protein LOC106867264 isoform X1 [Octopus bimaculoides]XP_014767569.1 uncharacterized protein LOC106867264 isoform X1 [Octopus bimaculoides]XP_052826772.1 uncharacterized protein LOC106867264 isoform X1 [Octopus bimaculoides]|eukprot:XP_014767567.1 PREDICTED: uncharacterized protein LOC106867264 isoform X1 [Octopus bimaculoides]